MWLSESLQGGGLIGADRDPSHLVFSSAIQLVAPVLAGIPLRCCFTRRSGFAASSAFRHERFDEVGRDNLSYCFHLCAYDSERKEIYGLALVAGYLCNFRRSR